MRITGESSHSRCPASSIPSRSISLLKSLPCPPRRPCENCQMCVISWPSPPVVVANPVDFVELAIDILKFTIERRQIESSSKRHRLAAPWRRGRSSWTAATALAIFARDSHPFTSFKQRKAQFQCLLNHLRAVLERHPLSVHQRSPIAPRSVTPYRTHGLSATS